MGKIKQFSSAIEITMARERSAQTLNIAFGKMLDAHFQKVFFQTYNMFLGKLRIEWIDQEWQADWYEKGDTIYWKHRCKKTWKKKTGNCDSQDKCIRCDKEVPPHIKAAGKLLVM